MSIILVTGGAGFIGSHLVDRLIELGNNVVIIDNLSSGKIKNLNSRAIFYNKNINENLDDIFLKYQFDYAFHVAAFIDLRKSIKDPYDCYNNNVMGSINLINYCVKYNIKNLIFSSTGGAIYKGDSLLPWNESTEAAPTSPYGLSKLAIEQYLKMANNLYKLNYSILRYANVIGPRQDPFGEAGVVSIFINKIKNNENLKIFGDGEQTRDFIYVSDVVSANLAVMNLKECDIYNVSSNKSISINYIANIILKEFKSFSNIEYLPSILGEVQNTKLSYDKLNKITRWKPYVDISASIKQLCK